LSKARFGVVVFPGSNCDHDAYNVLKHILQQDTEFLWHKDSSIGDRNVIVIPGGFSYGDYLRCGAIARFSNIMKEIVSFANKGGIVMGICNGFQIVCEAGLLPGTLLRNNKLKFVCRNVTLNIENKNTIFTKSFTGNLNRDSFVVPVAHGDGNYFCESDTLKELEEGGQIVFRYEDNPNGSIHNIAGIINKKGNVLGMMPHPERMSEDLLGGHEGKYIFESVIESLN
jgi:phosphoribosylformylglycinamidine synthase subunit PurQ / glutaminase